MQSCKPMLTDAHLSTCDDITGVWLPDQSCPQGINISISTGSYTPAQCFDPPT